MRGGHSGTNVPPWLDGLENLDLRTALQRYRSVGMAYIAIMIITPDIMSQFPLCLFLVPRVIWSISG